MKYRVEWLRRASTRLMEAAATASADQQQAIVSASLDVDKLLAEHPLEVGESREWASTRVVFVSPLIVSFHVDERVKLVRVLSADVMRGKRDRD